MIQFMPKSFENGVLDRQPISQGLLQSVRLVGEYRGKQALFKQQSSQVLEALRENAVIQSTQSSNRIEGVVAPLERIRELVAHRTTPANRSEQEIAGYREVLSTIHSHPEDIRLTPNVVLQLHRDLFQFAPGGGGHWKSTDNDITERRPDGISVVRFKPVPAHLTADAMDRLHTEFSAMLDAGTVEPLLLVPAYVLDFLCIHPFADGNGRMARLLSLLLLYQAGYEVGRYISLETAIEDTKEGYYDALQASSQNWHEGQHSLIPWWEVLRRRDAGEGVSRVRGSRRRDRRQARREAGHDSRCRQPLAERVSVRRPRARAASGEPSHDRSRAARAQRRRCRTVRRARSRCDLGKDT